MKWLWLVVGACHLLLIPALVLEWRLWWLLAAVEIVAGAALFRHYDRKGREGA